MYKFQKSDPKIAISSINQRKLGSNYNGSTVTDTDSYIEMDALLKIEKVAKIFDVSPKTVYYWVKSRMIPAVLLGRSVRVQKSVVQEIIDGRRSIV